MKVNVTEDFKYGGKTYEAGDKADLPEAVVESIEDKGYGERIGKIGEIEDLGESEGDNDGSTESEIVDAGDDFDMKSWAHTSNWLTAKTDGVERGSVFTVIGEKFMVQKFEDKEYPVVLVEFDGEEYNLRLNKSNTTNLAEEWGWKAEEWTGNEIEVATIQNYPNLNEKGLILAPANESD